MPEVAFKICIFGNGGVGKTTLMQRYLTGRFIETMMTIGTDIGAKSLNIKNSKVALQIWDFAGEERFRFFLPSYSTGAHGAVFMYDITRQSTLSDIDEWLKVFIPYPNEPQHTIPMIMVGGKADLVENRAVTKKKSKKIAKKYHFNSVYETSSLTGKNVDKIFSKLVNLMVKNAQI